MVEQWLSKRSDEAVFRGSVGTNPSMADVIKMVHPRPDTESQAALYAYLIGRTCDFAKLPELVRSFELFKKGESLEVPDVPFEMLTSLPLSPSDWKSIARNAPWQMTRMNLNTFARHGVFEDEELTMVIAERLANKELVRKSRVLPYQLMSAYFNCSGEVPGLVKAGLQDALDHALVNVPRIEGKVYVFPDVSGSMHSPVTGYRKGSSTAVRCVDVAALVAAAMVRVNPRARVIPFNDRVQEVELNPRDSVLTNAQKLSALPQGGTNCSAPLEMLNAEEAKADLVIYVSDNESWVDTVRKGEATQTMKQWARLKQRSPEAKMVCIDLQPYETTQATEREDILNVGGFSDQVFELIGLFANGSMSPAHWVGEIEEMTL
jgi:60 kDa SS-A/Ro ribonucleoprotein